MKRHDTVKKMLILALLPLLIMSLMGVSYALLFQELTIFGTVNTGSWNGGGTGACVEIQKTLSGAYTDPSTGKDRSCPINLIRIGSNSGILSVGEIACPPPNFPTKFKLCINVTNCGPTNLTQVVVNDRLENQFVPINATSSDNTDVITWINTTSGGSGFWKSYLIWDVGTLESGEWASLCIWIQTAPNPRGFYEPTSANADYLVNLGASVYANSSEGDLFAKTAGITLEIGDFVQPNIAEILTPLPYSTPWANDHIDPT